MRVHGARNGGRVVRHEFPEQTPTRFPQLDAFILCFSISLLVPPVNNDPTCCPSLEHILRSRTERTAEDTRKSHIRE
jgi:hypothetical protein